MKIPSAPLDAGRNRQVLNLTLEICVEIDEVIHLIAGGLPERMIETCFRANDMMAILDDEVFPPQRNGIPRPAIVSSLANQCNGGILFSLLLFRSIVNGAIDFVTNDSFHLIDEIPSDEFLFGDTIDHLESDEDLSFHVAVMG